MAEVVLKKVSKLFDKNIVAVDSVNVTVKDKEFIVLVGPSGCGKSTTLRMIAGLEEISAGEIYIDGRLVNDVPPKDRDIAMVFQNYALYPHMTIYDNMAFGLKLRKYPKDKIRQRVEETAEILSITGLLKRKPKVLSGGQRQRVAVGRAIVRRPKVFLFDEPLSNLDAKLRVQMRAEISKLHQQLKSTMIYVTHDQVEAMTMGDRIVVMKDGKVHQLDTPLNLYHHPVNKFVAGFIGSPAMNFLTCRVAKNGKFKLMDGKIEIPVPEKYQEKISVYVGKQVFLGIRPEDIYLPEKAFGVTEKLSLRNEVEVVEPMGNEVYIYLKTGAHNIIARLTADSLPKSGSQIDLIFDLSKMHLFDSDTENRIV
ncbi:MAG TPA: sn-glycerol-3-phosphate ABC transporter ATP-binding protein UgpC [Bacteroidetes bacterium]|nr:sn-glycerol-3-phosphate ABC transporter ATP-binding protein UgpC [Bacteroidota bacterium]